jgi:hypothetical protein
LARITAIKMGISEDVITKMIKYNEHNKYTTLYYLLIKKRDKGDPGYLEGINNEILVYN